MVDTGSEPIRIRKKFEYPPGSLISVTGVRCHYTYTLYFFCYISGQIVLCLKK